MFFSVLTAPLYRHRQSIILSQEKPSCTILPATFTAHKKKFGGYEPWPADLLKKITIFAIADHWKGMRL